MDNLHTTCGQPFPFLLGRGFIEAFGGRSTPGCCLHVPSFWEGLSLRPFPTPDCALPRTPFPFLFGGAFIEAGFSGRHLRSALGFPFLFGGAFIEATSTRFSSSAMSSFPFLLGGTFIEAQEEHHLDPQLCGQFPFLLGGTFIEAPKNIG